MQPLSFYFVFGICSCYLLVLTAGEQECGEIPGWKTTKLNGRRFTRDNMITNRSEHANVTDYIALNNLDDFDLKTCCDYRNKCSFQLQYHKSGNWCTLIFKCENPAPNYKLQRINDAGYWSATGYCNGLDSLTTMYGSTCPEAMNCLKNEQVPQTAGPWLDCLERVLGSNSNMDYKGFFSRRMFPYKEFRAFETETQIIPERL